jgi:hypothetical protein
MIAPEIQRLYNILCSFLGPSKDELDESLQLQFSCPHCQERDGTGEKSKYHLEVNIQKGLYNCWKCASVDDSMKGSVYKLIRKYGNQELLKDYKDTIKSFRESSLYQIHYDKDDFAVDYADAEENGLDIPQYYQKFRKGVDEGTQAFQYLQKRGIDWSIIDKYSLGFTTYHQDERSLSNRIILPSYDKFGDINYWTARDYTNNPKRQRYFNPVVERKKIIFNEEKVEWNADVTLVEGPFDHIVVPNSIPLLGKVLNPQFELFYELIDKCKANCNIFLDADAIETVKVLYKTLDNTKLNGRVRYIPVKGDYDPSKIFEEYGRKGIVTCLGRAKRLSEQELFTIQ